MADAPIHETQVVYGVTEECKYNDHPMCHSPRCGCSCHRQSRVEADRTGINRVVATENRATGVQTGLDKYCPICKGKAPFDQFYCKKDGNKLSSLRCPECQTPGDAEDNFCGHCGCSMKVEDRELEAAATGSGIANGLSESSLEDAEVAESKMREAMAARSSSGGGLIQTSVVKVGNSKISVGMFK